MALSFPEKLRGLLYFEPAKKGRGYEYVDLWINREIRNSSIFKELVEQGSAMVEKAEKLIRASQDLVAQLEAERRTGLRPAFSIELHIA